jgi:hypothetical protein
MFTKTHVPIHTFQAHSYFWGTQSILAAGMSEPSNPIFSWIEKSAKKKAVHESEKEKEHHAKPEKDKSAFLAEAEAVFVHEKKEKKPKEEKERKEKVPSESKPHAEAEKKPKDRKEKPSSPSEKIAKKEAQSQPLFEKIDDPQKEKKEKKDFVSLIPKSPRKEAGLRDSEGQSKESNSKQQHVNPELPFAAIDTSEFLASDYITTDAALAKEVLAKARKPCDTVVGKVLLVYRKKETDPCPEASHIVTIRYGERSYSAAFDICLAL